MQKVSLLRHLSHFFVYCIFLSLCIGAQVVIWPSLKLPEPQLWLLPLAFVVLYRSFWFGLLFVYATAFILSGFTVLPFGLTLAVLIIVFIFIQFFKQRFFWPEFSFYFLVSLAIAFIFPVLHFSLALTSKSGPAILTPEFSKWIYQPIMLAFVSYFIFYLCQKIDKKLKANEFSTL